MGIFGRKKNKNGTQFAENLNIPQNMMPGYYGNPYQQGYPYPQNPNMVGAQNVPQQGQNSQAQQWGAQMGQVQQGQNFGQTAQVQENVAYNPGVAQAQIDMNPPKVQAQGGNSVIIEEAKQGDGAAAKEVSDNGEKKVSENGEKETEKPEEKKTPEQLAKEAAEKSSVVAEPVDEKPKNGFPLGFGPNEGMKRVEKPKKPSIFERLKHNTNKMDPKKRKRVIVGALAGVAVIGILIIVGTFVGVFKTDYSGAYITAKEVRTEMQKLKSDSNCERVNEELTNKYTTMPVYSAYVDKCREVGQGINLETIAALGKTEGVRRDAELRAMFNTFELTASKVGQENADVDGILNVYSKWHQWVVAEMDGDANHNEWDWSGADIQNAVKILTESEVPEFKAYGEEWARRKMLVANAYNAYYRPEAAGTSMLNYNAARVNYESLKADFQNWKSENEPQVKRTYPLTLASTAKLFSEFNELYTYVAEKYEENYNKRIGGCKEYVNEIVCD